MRSRLRGLACFFAVAYPVVLLASLAAFRYVGERWWVTGIALYLPRIGFALPLPVVVVAVMATRQRWPAWAALAASIVLLFVLAGFVPAGLTKATAGAPKLRVLTYNIDSASGGADAIASEVRRYSADVVLLEEMAEPEPLTGILRANYPTVEVVGQFLLATREHLVSRSEPERIDYEGRLRSPRSVKYELETSIGRIALYQVHPISPREALNDVRGHGLRYEFLSGRVLSPAHGAIFRANSGLRALQIRAVADEAAADRDPVIIAGDTNLPVLSYLFGQYLSGYKDAFVEAGWGLGYTFPRHHGPWMRIDRVLAGQGLRFVGFEVGTSLASDHRCVVADVERE